MLAIHRHCVYKYLSSPSIRCSHVLSCLPLDRGKKRMLMIPNTRSYYDDSIFAHMLNSKPVITAQEMLVNFHDYSGLPWWATIALTTITLRGLVTFPMSVFQYQVMAKYQNLLPHLEQIKEHMKTEGVILVKKHEISKQQAAAIYALSFKNYRSKKIIEHNCHPMKGTLVIYFQIPIWITLSFALRGLSMGGLEHDLGAQLTFNQLANEGLLWITNLTLPDSTMILPITLALVNLSLIELNVTRAGKLQSKLAKVVTNVMRGFSIVLIPISMTMPSCLCFYWTISSCFGLAQNVILMSPNIRRRLGIQKTASESETPYQQLLTNVKARLSK